MTVEIRTPTSALINGELYLFQVNDHGDVIWLAARGRTATGIDVEYSQEWAPVARQIELARQV